MTPHFVLMYGVFGLALAAQSWRLTKGAERVLWISVVLVLGVFAGLRGDFVGADTISYVSRFEYLKAIGAAWDEGSSTESGYKSLLYLARMLSDNPTTHLLITSFVASSLYVTAIYRLSLAPALSIILFIAFGFYAFHMNGLRQGLAIGIYMHALPSLLSGRMIRYAVLVCIAATFHVTAIFTLPLYFLFRLGFSLKSFVILIVIAAITASATNLMFEYAGLANDRFVRYGQRSETRGVIISLFYIILSIFFIFARTAVRHEWKYIYNIFLTMMSFGSIIYIIVIVSGIYIEVTRMALYFTVSLCFLLPIIIYSFDNIHFRNILILITLILGSMYYYIFLTQIGGYVPYVMR